MHNRSSAAPVAPARTVTPIFAAPAAPPFRPGDKVLFRQRPDGVETVVDVIPCRQFGRHSIRTRRQLSELVQAYRYARTSQFQFARTDETPTEKLTGIMPGSPLRRPGTSSWDWGRAGVLPLAAGGLSLAFWLAITGAFVVAAWVLP